VNATTLPQLGSLQFMDLQLDVSQRAWGLAPLISLAFHKGPLTVTARYEFRTKLNTKNDTKALSVSMTGQTTDIKAMAEQAGNEATLAAIGATMGTEMADKIKNYMPDEHVRYDMPSLLVVGVGYEFTPKLRATLEYHFFDDKNAKMADDRQKELTHGTHEVLAGIEWDINKKFTVSCGAQRTDYGLSDGYQQNTSFACDSYSIGLGGAWNINPQLRLNAGYFITLYSDYTHNQDSYLGTNYPGKDIYSRTNNVIGLGIDYRF
jgi:long-chain fatty acid transport protein